MQASNPSMRQEDQKLKVNIRVLGQLELPETLLNKGSSQGGLRYASLSFVSR